MLSYQKKLYGLVQEVGISNEKLQRESYQALEQAFLDRWTTMLVAQLSAEDQKFVATKLQQGASIDDLYEFLDASLPDIDKLNQQILDDFVDQARDTIGL